jgi:hypothetical protein
MERGERRAFTIYLDPEAGQILDRLAPGRSKGRFISRLLHVHEAQRVAREEALAEVGASKAG